MKMTNPKSSEPLSVGEAFKVLEHGFKWSCDEEVTIENFTREQVVKAFKEEICVLGKLNFAH